MDKDLEDRLAKINIENDMNRSLQLEMLLTSAKMIRDESLRGKSVEYRDAWWDGFHFLRKLDKEEREIKAKLFNQWEKELEKISAENIERILDHNYYPKRDALRRKVAETLRAGIQTLFKR
jgi:hypothetical protein